jgi:hypothetical protein
MQPLELLMIALLMLFVVVSLLYIKGLEKL